MSNLNSAQFPLFHGTGRAIEGNEIRPGRAVGFTNYGRIGDDVGEPSHDHAWASPGEHVAWSYAVNTSHRQASRDNLEPEHRARVHEVVPNPHMVPGKTITVEDHGEQEFRAPSFTKTGVVHDIMPGRQGTFPNVNWKQFQSSSHGTLHDYYIADFRGDSSDANHPAHPSMPEEVSGREIPNMRPKSHPTLPLGDIEVKQWDGKMARQSVDSAVNDRTLLHDRQFNTVTPASHMPEHRAKYPNVGTR